MNIINDSLKVTKLEVSFDGVVWAQVGGDSRTVKVRTEANGTRAEAEKEMFSRLPDYVIERLGGEAKAREAISKLIKLTGQ